MKVMFANAISSREPNYDKIVELINNIPESKVAICYSNQFKVVAEKIKAIVDKEVISSIQTLGCSNPKFSDDTEAIIIFGQGKFHTVSLAYESGLSTYVIEGNTLWKVSSEEIEKMKKKERGAMLKYLNSDKVGILMTTKPGQRRIEKAVKFKKGLKDKKSYIFVANDLNVAEFENFGLDCFVNTACPRMDLTEGSILNLEKVEKLLQSQK